MNPWRFVIAAYALVIGASLVATLWAWIAMRRAERHAEDVTGR